MEFNEHDGVKQLKAYIQKNTLGIVFTGAVKVHKGKVVGYYKKGSPYIMLLAESLTEACGESGAIAVAKLLREYGYLNTQSNNKTDPRMRGRLMVGGKRVSGYLIHLKFLYGTGEIDSSDIDALKRCFVRHKLRAMIKQKVTEKRM